MSKLSICRFLLGESLPFFVKNRLVATQKVDFLKINGKDSPNKNLQIDSFDIRPQNDPKFWASCADFWMSDSKRFGKQKKAYK